MFSMIIVLISIALVAALAVATMWYGGEAMSAGAIQSAVAGTINQAQQIATATNNFSRARNARLPANVADLVNNGFLGSTPLGDQVFTDGAWFFVNSGNHLFASIEVETAAADAPEFCRRINERSSGGVLTDPEPSFGDAQQFPFFCATASNQLFFYYRI